MARKKNTAPLTLEHHLQSFSDNKAFNFLCSSWITEKEQYRKRLDSIPTTFPTYSSHTADHSEVILTRIESLLGEDRIRLLSPTDTWLLLQCAYTHDLGMCVSEAEKNKVFEDYLKDIDHFKSLLDDKDFIDFLRSLQLEQNKKHSNPEKALFASARFLLTARDNNDDQTMIRFVNQLKNIRYSQAKNMAAIVIMSYFRKKHAVRTKIMLDSEAPSKTYEGVFPLRLRKLVAKIDYCHGGSWRDVMNLDKEDGGFSKDFAHPRFIAVLLRLGDLLDLDSNRFNEFQIDLLDGMPKVSIAHEMKHKAISRLFVSPEEIRIKAEYNFEEMREILDRHYFPNRNSLSNEEKDDETKELIDLSAKSLRDWLKMIEDELYHFSKKWKHISPQNMPEGIASLEEKDIIVFGAQVSEDDLSLRYSISSSRSAQLIEGADLYRSTWAFIRELTQNAIDASKRQLGRDAIHYYPKEDSNYLRYPEYYCNLQLIQLFEPVRVIIHYISKTKDMNAKLEFIIIDQGIGITFDKLKQMRSIGAISKSSEELKEIRSLPIWLRPTGEYGIGMQSVFPLADYIKINTYPSNEDGKPSNTKRHIKFYCPELGGDIVSREEQIKDSSTEFHTRPVYKGTDVFVSFDLYGDIILKLLFDNQVHEFGRSHTSEIQSETMLSCYQGRSQATLLDEDVVFSQLRRYISETFTHDVIGLRFYFLKNEHPDRGWRDFIHEYDKNDHSNSVIQFGFPELEYAITTIPKQKNYLSSSNLEIQSSNETVWFWYNSEAEIPSDDESVLLTLKNNNNSSKIIHLFYRGIAVCTEPGTSSLFNSFGIPGVDLTINVMSGNVSRFLEINREYVKATGYLELNNIIRNALRSFYHSVAKWEADNNQIYYRNFWKNNPEHRLLFHLVCKYYNYESTIFDGCDFFIKQYSIQSRITEDHTNISNILNSSTWFANIEKIKTTSETLDRNTTTGSAIIDTISELFDFDYHEIQVIRSAEWYNKYFLRYTLTTMPNLPIIISDKDYGNMCITILCQHLDSYLNEKESRNINNFGNYILSIPAIERFNIISVSQIPAESLGGNLSHFNRFVILPFKIKDLVTFYLKLHQKCAEGESFEFLPNPLGKKELFSDVLLNYLTADLGEKEDDIEKQFAKYMQQFIDSRIMDRLEKRADKKKVYATYSELLKMIRFDA